MCGGVPFSSPHESYKYMDKGREADIQKLKTDLKTAKNPLQVRKINEAAQKITEEQRDKYKRDAREALLRAAKNGDPKAERDVADQIIEHNKKTNISSMAIHWPEGLYEKVFGHR